MNFPFFGREKGEVKESNFKVQSKQWIFILKCQNLTLKMTIYKAELPKVEIEIYFYKEILTEKLSQKLVLFHLLVLLCTSLKPFLFFPYYQGKVVQNKNCVSSPSIWKGLALLLFFRETAKKQNETPSKQPHHRICSLDFWSGTYIPIYVRNLIMHYVVYIYAPLNLSEGWAFLYSSITTRSGFHLVITNLQVLFQKQKDL